jgi:hypothetical protein
MNQVRCFRTFSLTMIALMIHLMASAQVGGTDAIQQRLFSQFSLTTVTADRSDIVSSGSAVQLHRDGLLMYSVDSPVVPSNTYKDGKVSQGFLYKRFQIPGQPVSNQSPGGYPMRAFVHGENCWVTQVEAKKDGVEFSLYSDPYDNVRYYAKLKIPFPNKKDVPAVDAFLATVAEILAVVPSQDQAASVPASAAPQYAPPSPQASYQELAPPPPPPAPAPTLSVGMTRDQVLASVGEPARKAVAGAKEIYFYTDMKMKVTFTKGTVSGID